MLASRWIPDLSHYPGPKYLALVRALREAIREGVLEPGAQLPTVRDLAWDLKVTPGTVSRAYQQATQEGLLAATVGRGTFVASRHPRFGPSQSFYAELDPGTLTGRVDMRAPRLPDVGQGAAFGAALAGLSQQMAGEWLDYPTQSSEQSLREALVGWISGRVLGPSLKAEDIALSYGGQHGVTMVLQCCLRGDRPVVLTEELSYAGFRHAARLMRADVVGVELDQHGLRPDALELACRRHAPQVLCLTTEAQNPTTVVMPETRRKEIVEIARSYEVQLIEDDCYSVIRSERASLRALAPERTWFIGSFSKSVSAALRFGYVICPSGMGQAGQMTAQHSIFALARPVADLSLELLLSGAAEELRRKVQDVYADLLAGVVNVLGKHQLSWQPGLPFVWLTLPAGWRASTFARMAEAEGVLIRSADEFALIHARAPDAVRLALPGHHSRAQIEEACRKLSQLLDRPPTEISV